MTGPIIGSALFALLGYEKMFYVYGGLEMLLAIVMWNRILTYDQSTKQRDLEEKFATSVLCFSKIHKSANF